MLNKWLALSLIAGAAAALPMLSACGEDEQDFERADMLESLGQNVITATNDDLLSATDELAAASDTFCESPDADGLESARQSWMAAKQALKKMESYSFGPYRFPGVEVAMRLDKWPGRGANIEDILSGDETIDVDFVASQDYRDRTKGFPAMGYLLYGAPDDTDTLAAYTDAEFEADRRCQYLVAASQRAADLAATYHGRWQDDDGYLEDFVNAGPDSNSFPTTQDAITDVMGAMMFALDEIAMMKFAVPAGLGADGDGTAIPEDVEAPYSATSIEHALWSLDGVEALYLGGDDGLGLSDYVQFRQQTGAVDDTVRERIDGARQAIEAIDAPLSEAVVDNPESVEAAIDAVDALNRALSGEVATLLGINPTTVEGDND